MTSPKRRKFLSDEEKEQDLSKSTKELKEDFYQLMCFFSENSVSGELVTDPELAAVPSGDFSTGGFFTDLELAIVPLIEVKSYSYGILSFPLNESTFNLLKPLC